MMQNVCEIDTKLNCCGMAGGEYEIANRKRTRECEVLPAINPYNLIDLRNLIQ